MDANQKFSLGTITRAEIADMLNSAIGQEIYSDIDDRLTDDICNEFVNVLQPAATNNALREFSGLVMKRRYALICTSPCEYPGMRKGRGLMYLTTYKVLAESQAGGLQQSYQAQWPGVVISVEQCTEDELPQFDHHNLG